MELDMRRLILRSAVASLIEERAIEENVDRCLENLKSLYQDVEDVHHVRRRRSHSGWTDAAIEQLALKNLGHFHVDDCRSGKERKISFTDVNTGEGITLCFVRGECTPEEQLDPIVRFTQAAQDPTMINDIAAAVVGSIAIQQVTGPGELILRHATTALTGYRLVRVTSQKRKTNWRWPMFKFKTKTLFGKKE